MTNQGEFWKLNFGGAVFTVVIVSGDTWNEHNAPVVAPLIQRGLDHDLPPALIKLHEMDQYRGVLDMREIGTSLGGTFLPTEGERKTVIGDTMGRIRQAVKDMLDD